jgi:hypothetical protein
MLLAKQPPQHLAAIRSALTLLVQEQFSYGKRCVFLFRQRYYWRPLRVATETSMAHIAVKLAPGQPDIRTLDGVGG